MNAYYNLTRILCFSLGSPVACIILYNVDTNDFYKFSVTYEAYAIASLIPLYLKNLNLYTNYTETSSSVSVQHPSIYLYNISSILNPQTYSEILCVCTTFNCNVDLGTCINGFTVSTTVATTASTSSAPPSSISKFF